MNLAIRLYRAFKNKEAREPWQVLLGKFAEKKGWLPEFQDAVYVDRSLFIPRPDVRGGGYVQIREEGHVLQIQALSPPAPGPTGLWMGSGETAVWEAIARGYREIRNYAQALRALVSCFGDYQSVGRYYEKVTEGTYKDPDLMRELGFLQMGSGNLDAALKSLSDMANSPRADDMQRRMRLLFPSIKEGEFNKAHIQLNKILYETSPYHGIYRGFLFLCSNDLAHARVEFLKALERDSTNVHAWRVLAFVLEKQKEKGKAQWIRNRIARGPPTTMTYSIVQRFSEAVGGVDRFFEGMAPIDRGEWAYHPDGDIYQHKDNIGMLAKRQPDGLFGVEGGGLPGENLTKRLARRDQKIQAELQGLQDADLDRHQRSSAADFLSQYLAPRQERSKALVDAIASLMQELREIRDDRKALKPVPPDQDSYEQAFLDQLDLISAFPIPEVVEALLNFMEEGPPDITRAYVSRVLAAKFSAGWPVELMDGPLVEKFRISMEKLLSDSSVAEARLGNNEVETIFHNMAGIWEETRNPELIDFFIGVVEKDKWKPLTLRAAAALKDSWRLYNRQEPKKVQGWVSRLKAVALSDSNDMAKRAVALGALAGVKEESAGVEALTEILQSPKVGPYLRLKAMEVVSMYARRGDLSTLSRKKAIGAESLLMFLKNSIDFLRQDRPQLGIGMMGVDNGLPSMNVIDVTELFGLLLSVILRDGHAQGPAWNTLQMDISSVIADLGSDRLGKKPLEISMLRPTIIENTQLAQILGLPAGGGTVSPMTPHVAQQEAWVEERLALRVFVQFQAAARKVWESGRPLSFLQNKEPVTPYFQTKPRQEAFPLYEYFGVPSVFGKEILGAHDPHRAFVKGLFRDLSLTDFLESRLITDTAGQALVKIVKNDLGNFLPNILEGEDIVERIAHGERPYGLGTWKEVLEIYRRVKAHTLKGISANPYAHGLWQKNLSHLVIRSLLDEWDVDSPQSRPYTRIKILHAIEILPAGIFHRQFHDVAGVTVDDRWIVLPDDIFSFGKNLPWDVTTIGHEIQHWLRGSDDIGMLGAAVLYGLDHELGLLIATSQIAPRPLEQVLGKIQRRESLTVGEKNLISPEFRAGVELAFDSKIEDAKSGLLKIFQNFKWAVNDWPWVDIVAARGLLPGEIVNAYTPQGKEYRQTDTYKEGAKLAGYLMGLCSRVGYFEGWQVFAELLAKRPEKFKGRNKRRLNPAEAYFVVQVLGGLAREDPSELHAIQEGIAQLVATDVKREGLPTQSDAHLDKRVAKKIEDFIKRDAVDVDIPEGATYTTITPEAQRTIHQMRQALKGPRMQTRIAASVFYDIAQARPAPFVAPRWSIFDQSDKARHVVGEQL